MTIFDELSETAVESERETSPTAPIDARHEAQPSDSDIALTKVPAKKRGRPRKNPAAS